MLQLRMIILYITSYDQIIQINECKMRIPWHVWLKVKKHFLVEIWDRINNTWMTVPRAIYLKVKHHYDKDMTFMYDRINECPMRVSWHQYCKVSALCIFGLERIFQNLKLHFYSPRFRAIISIKID